MKLLRDIHVCGWISQAFIFAAGRQQRPRGETKLSQPAKTVDSKEPWDEAKVIVLQPAKTALSSGEPGNEATP